MKTEDSAAVSRASTDFLKVASNFFNVPDCGIRVLSARPLRVREHMATELFGDYYADQVVDADSSAQRGHVFRYVLEHAMPRVLAIILISNGSDFLTRGTLAASTERAAALYDYARDTAPKRLFWVPVAGGRWRIDWPRTNRSA
jgi:hypothetical protein